MNNIKVQLKKQIDNSYEIMVGKNILTTLPQILKKRYLYNHYIIITDNKVKKLYGLELKKNLQTNGLKTDLLSFPAGEKSKTQKTKTQLEESLLCLGAGRDTLIIALGGGVVGDLAGFVSATYMRGLPYIQIPTTLLAMVDSSVGGKTGIDTEMGKNTIGAFHQPQFVLADMNCLKTLPQTQYINGLVEAVKMFLTHDAEMVNFVEKNLTKILARDEKILKQVIERAITIKAGVVNRDELEHGERTTLNFGHTIGHALELLSNYKLLHGYAIGQGILIESKISESLNILSIISTQRIEKIINALGIKVGIQKNQINKIIQNTRVDKKNLHGQARYILLQDIGKVYTKNGQYTHVIEEKIIKNIFK